MAWRLHEHVLRGKIDNRTRGRVKGEIWLAGIDQSLVLDLTGDGAPDLAGCELSFENPKPIPMTRRRHLPLPLPRTARRGTGTKFAMSNFSAKAMRRRNDMDGC